MESIFLDTIHFGKSSLDGGTRRCNQLVELIARAGFGVSLLDGQAGILERHLRGLELMLAHGFKLKPNRLRIATAGQAYAAFRKALARHEEPRLLVWETTYRHVAAHMARRLGCRLLAVPENLESLVPGQMDPYTDEKGLASLRRELALMARADAVFTISREEEWLLRTLGIEASWLPYFPAGQFEKELLKVREARKSAARTRFLLLGSAVNPPTRSGLVRLLADLHEFRGRMPFAVDIAGTGTEDLASQVTHPDFTVHGAVSPEKLDALLTSARAAIIHQAPSSGALTRIPELLLAGIPVLANENACRSYWNYPGLYPYADRAGLQALMTSDQPEPAPPERPVRAEQRFIDCVRNLARR